MLLLLTFSAVANGQFIEVIPITDGTGFLAIKTEQVNIIKEYRSFIHTVNFSKHEESYQMIKNTVNEIEDPLPNTIKFLMNDLEKELKFFKFHHHRQRRGLVNALGVGIKFITGNLDEDDLNQINERLAAMETNEENVSKFSKNLVNFSSHLDAELKTITDHIDNETIYISKTTKDIYNTVHGIEAQWHQKMITDSITLNLQILSKHISNIKQAITFSKFGILSSEMLDASELPNISIDQY